MTIENHFIAIAVLQKIRKFDVKQEKVNEPNILSGNTLYQLPGLEKPLNNGKVRKAGNVCFLSLFKN